MAEKNDAEGVLVTHDAPDLANSEPSQYITGWRLHSNTFWLLLSLFVVQMDTSITSTSILTITNELEGFEISSWVFTAYMLSFCGFQLIWAKLSDIVSRKVIIMACLLMFTVFSGACAASQTLVQLIMFRWVQGIGGCGVFALVQLAFFELVPQPKWPTYVSLVSGVIALSLVIGPLVGGAIAQTGNWRWIFLLNVPICGIASIALFFGFPTKLWNEPSASSQVRIMSSKSVRRIDFMGAILLLGACLLVSTGLQQAALGYAWTSAYVLPLVLMTVPFLFAFLAWEWHVTTRRVHPEPVFPWRFIRSRICMGMVLNTFFSGASLMICLVQIPQRFMTVNGLSSLDAALRLLAFGAFVPSGSTFAALLMGKFKILPCFIILAGAVLQLIGAALLSRIPSTPQIHTEQYGYQIVLGLGIGFVACGLIMLVPLAMEQRDLAVGTAAMAQFRVLGGVIGLSIATAVSTPYIRTHLAQSVSPDVALSVLGKTENVHLFPSGTQDQIKQVFGDGFNLQVFLAIGFAAAQLPSSALMWTNRRVVS